MTRKNFEIDGNVIVAGTWTKINISIAEFQASLPMSLSLDIYHGKRPGPTLLITAAIHGDELNGIEICRRLLCTEVSKMKGTLIVIPVVNTPGYLQGSRYLPDRRDLNRLFPGSSKGSLGGKIAKILTDKILSRADLVLDLHTAAIHRSNLPQIRIDASVPEALRLARAFGAPLILDSQLRDGSFRSTGDTMGTPVLVYEAGEALRLNDAAITLGLRGIKRVMRALKMLPANSRKVLQLSIESKKSQWQRATASGLVLNHVRLGQQVKKGECLASINQPLDIKQSVEVNANLSGIIIGLNRLATVYEGDALFHIAQVGSTDEVDDMMEVINEQFNLEPINNLPEDN